MADQVSAIDGELREHAIAAARAAAVRDREMPTVKAALDAVRAELGNRIYPNPRRPPETGAAMKPINPPQGARMAIFVTFGGASESLL